MSAALRSLPASVEVWLRLRDRIAAEFQIEAHDEAMPDTLDGMTDLGDRCHALMRQAAQDEAFADALSGLILNMEIRRNRYLKRAKAVREAVAEAAHEAGLSTLRRPDMTISFGMSKPSLTGSADPASLPDHLVRIKREPNRTAIKAEIDAGRHVEGYALSNGKPSLTVRRT